MKAPIVNKKNKVQIQAKKFNFEDRVKKDAVIYVGTPMLLSGSSSQGYVNVFINNDMSTFYEISITDWDNCVEL